MYLYLFVWFIYVIRRKPNSPPYVPHVLHVLLRPPHTRLTHHLLLRPPTFEPLFVLNFRLFYLFVSLLYTCTLFVWFIYVVRLYFSSLWKPSYDRQIAGSDQHTIDRDILYSTSILCIRYVYMLVLFEHIDGSKAMLYFRHIRLI